MWNIVRLNSKYNLIDENFKLLSEQWFEKMEFSNENSPSANTDDVYVYALIDKHLHIIDPRTKKTIYTVGCNYYQPQRISNALLVFGQSEVSYITINNGKIMHSQWFKTIVADSNGYFYVERWDSTRNIMKSDGKLMFPKWYDAICKEYSLGGFKVMENGKWNIIKDNDELFSPKWFDNICGFRYVTLDTFAAQVKLNGKSNYVNKNGELLFTKWYDDIDYIGEERSIVKLGDKKAVIDKEENVIGEKYDRIILCGGNSFANLDGIYCVGKNGKQTYMKPNGELLVDTWFDNVYSFYDGYAIVTKNGKSAYIDKKGKILGNRWFDDCQDFEQNMGAVTIDNVEYIFTINGELIGNQ